MAHFTPVSFPFHTSVSHRTVVHFRFIYKTRAARTNVRAANKVFAQITIYPNLVNNN